MSNYEDLNIWELITEARKSLDSAESELGHGKASDVHRALAKVQEIVSLAREELCEMVRSQ